MAAIRSKTEPITAFVKLNSTPMAFTRTIMFIKLKKLNKMSRILKKSGVKHLIVFCSGVKKPHNK